MAEHIRAWLASVWQRARAIPWYVWLGLAIGILGLVVAFRNRGSAGAGLGSIPPVPGVGDGGGAPSGGVTTPPLPPATTPPVAPPLVTPPLPPVKAPPTLPFLPTSPAAEPVSPPFPGNPAPSGKPVPPWIVSANGDAPPAPAANPGPAAPPAPHGKPGSSPYFAIGFAGAAPPVHQDFFTAPSTPAVTSPFHPSQLTVPSHDTRRLS